ncbi:hypothetical protein PPERSA_01036 [Pseudocohnilembus persalinus]|uniref:Rubicon Homology domain-containing protein n=1 Tax=Pseudocohnilembus persalinus TaxID=266149 RepID=A0A0V0QUY5_PSEPJ|nr:hypothetical protein PPERSA_01036 [Pseudocohnilembus persalinus]|eukprot:KRX05958.1 hypothetical protein PPERSA_01036 [Pseudocohnilembus persalinus]
MDKVSENSDISDKNNENLNNFMLGINKKASEHILIKDMAPSDSSPQMPAENNDEYLSNESSLSQKQKIDKQDAYKNEDEISNNKLGKSGKITPKNIKGFFQKDKHSVGLSAQDLKKLMQEREQIRKKSSFEDNHIQIERSLTPKNSCFYKQQNQTQQQKNMQSEINQRQLRELSEFSENIRIHPPKRYKYQNQNTLSQDQIFELKLKEIQDQKIFTDEEEEKVQQVRKISLDSKSSETETIEDSKFKDYQRHQKIPFNLYKQVTQPIKIRKTSTQFSNQLSNYAKNISNPQNSEQNSPIKLARQGQNQQKLSLNLFFEHKNLTQNNSAKQFAWPQQNKQTQQQNQQKIKQNQTQQLSPKEEILDHNLLQVKRKQSKKEIFFAKNNIEYRTCISNSKIKNSYTLQLKKYNNIDPVLITEKPKCLNCKLRIHTGLMKLFSNPAFKCSYNGKYYCKKCFGKYQRFVPWAITENWDFTKYAVSRTSAQILDQQYKIPQIKIEYDSKIVKDNPELFDFLVIRRQIYLLYDTICDEKIFTQIIKPFNLNLAIRDNIFSMKNLIQIKSGFLTQYLHATYLVLEQHVKNCEICKRKSYICLICQSLERIFVHDIQNTKLCKQCQRIYHKKCFNKPEKCVICRKVMSIGFPMFVLLFLAKLKLNCRRKKMLRVLQAKQKKQELKQKKNQ